MLIAMKSFEIVMNESFVTTRNGKNVFYYESFNISCFFLFCMQVDHPNGFQTFCPKLKVYWTFERRLTDQCFFHKGVSIHTILIFSILHLRFGPLTEKTLYGKCFDISYRRLPKIWNETLKDQLKLLGFSYFWDFVFIPKLIKKKTMYFRSILSSCVYFISYNDKDFFPYLFFI